MQAVADPAQHCQRQVVLRLRQGLGGRHLAGGEDEQRGSAGPSQAEGHPQLRVHTGRHQEETQRRRGRDCHDKSQGHCRLSAGQDADDDPVPALHLRPLAVLRRESLPPDERAEADLAVSRLRQSGPLRKPYGRRVLP